jgi:hypothetical protein
VIEENHEAFSFNINSGVNVIRTKNPRQNKREAALLQRKALLQENLPASKQTLWNLP